MQGGTTTQPRTSSSGPSDAALVVAARAGEDWACEALFRRYSSMANGLALRLLGRDEDVDDIVQDSFVEALRSLHRLDAPQAFSSWLGAIVIRTSAKLIRRRRVQRRLGLRHNDAPVDVDSLLGSATPPDVAVELRALYRAFATLPTDVRVALVLRVVEGMTLEEAASYAGTSLATIKRRLAKGQLLLDQLIEERKKES